MQGPGESLAQPRPWLRERLFESGERDLSDAELLTVLIGSGASGRSARTVAQEMLESAGSLARLAEGGAHGALDCRGVGLATAARLMAAVELGRRVALGQLESSRQCIDSYQAVADWARPRLAGLDHEEVWLLCLDARNGVKSRLRVAQGGQHGCALTPRDILRPAIRDAASGIVLIHNHPSGDPTPSREDVAMTEQVALAADLVGIPLLDHVVVARDGARSLRELGLLGT